MSFAALDALKNLREQPRKAVEQDLLTLEKNALDSLRFRPLKEWRYPFGLSDIEEKAQSQEREIIHLSSARDILVQGFGNKTAYVHIYYPQSKGVDFCGYIDFQTQTFVNLMDIDENMELRAGQDPVGESKKDDQFSAQSWHANFQENYINIPPASEVKGDVSPGTHQFVLLLSLIAPAHEIWHILESKAQPANKRLLDAQRSIAESIKNLEAFFLHKEPEKRGSAQERAAMKFALTLLRHCEKSGIDLLREDTVTGENKVKKLLKVVKIALHW